MVEIFMFWYKIKAIFCHYIDRKFHYSYMFKVFIGHWYKSLNIINLKLLLLLLDRNCAYATHLRLQSSDAVLLKAAITNCLGWLIQVKSQIVNSWL